MGRHQWWAQRTDGLRVHIFMRVRPTESGKTSGLAITTSDEYKVLVTNRCDAAALAPASCTDKLADQAMP